MSVRPALAAAQPLRRAARCYTTPIKHTPSKSGLHRPIPDTDFPSGFQLAAIHAGIKKSPDALDLAVILSDAPANRSASAACFTQNAFRAAPVLVCEEVLASNKRARGLVVNSGCANAVTGSQGLDVARSMSKATDALLNGSQNESLVMSTGVIGVHLPKEKVLTGIRDCKPLLGSGFSAWEMAAKAFMTTDTFPKLRARSATIAGTPVRLAGMDKGAGMIHPRMGPPSGLPHATLLGLVATDAFVEPDALQAALTHAVQRSFNSISVDGDMSTNDTIIALSNGSCGASDAISLGTKAFEQFQTILTETCVELAQLVIRDGEGARKFITIDVEGAGNFDDAHKVASTISTSMLVKTAIYGEDANWGRILASTGSTSDSLSQPINPQKVSVSFIPNEDAQDKAPLVLLKHGEPQFLDEQRAKALLEQEDINIKVDLGLGNASAKYWTCDLSHEYVSINGDYRS